MKSYTNKAKAFYKSKAWLCSRRSYIDKRVMTDGGLCEHCKERLGYIVDHKEELDDIKLDNPQISLNEDNYQYLCVPCHNRKTFSNEKKGVRFNEDGEPIFFSISPP